MLFHGAPFDPERRALLFGLIAAPLIGRAARAAPRASVPILCYHRFGPAAVDSMTVRTSNFESHLRVLEQLKCTVIPLANVVAWRRGAMSITVDAPLPPRAVVLTADDGHQSQFDVMMPRLQSRGWPVTLFVYPSAISNASYAMTWPQVQALAAQPGVSVQSHTLWHPNFLQERKRLSPEAFTAFAATQLQRSRDTLQQHLSRPVTLLAWPFGLSDEGVRAQAAECGYEAAMALGDRAATIGDPLYALPRYLMVDGINDRQLAARLRAVFAAEPA